MNTTVVIVGGGLSGLCTAYGLVKRGIPFLLLEARDRLGGRILSETGPNPVQSASPPAIDLGPSWFWPGQSHIEQLIAELQLQEHVYEQSFMGDTVMEYADGSLQKSSGAASMAGSYRLDGGLSQLINSLANQLPKNSVYTGIRINTIAKTHDGVQISSSTGDGDVTHHDASHVVIAAPPRVVSNLITFTPALSDERSKQLSSIKTWMAAQAKCVALYREPFWITEGLSGDGLSQVGPLVEIHDASARTEGLYALFGFIGIPPDQRRGKSEEIKHQVVDQLVRMFGHAAQHPEAVYFKDWADDSLTCTELDISNGHGPNVNRASLSEDWEGSIVWAGSETADNLNHSNGYLEGAVEAGFRAANILQAGFGSA